MGQGINVARRHTLTFPGMSGYRGGRFTPSDSGLDEGCQARRRISGPLAAVARAYQHLPEVGMWPAEAEPRFRTDRSNLDGQP
jgi:hypothetical protein